MDSVKELIKEYRWKYADNYCGEDFSEYIQGCGQNRDSNILTQSNFGTLLDLLGGESKTVIILRSGHWACGWVEQILVHESDKKSLGILLKVHTTLEDYPILDDDDFNEREQEEREETIKNERKYWAQTLCKELGFDYTNLSHEEQDQIESFCSYSYEEQCGYRGQEDSWFNPEESDCYRAVEFIRSNFYYNTPISERDEFLNLMEEILQVA